MERYKKIIGAFIAIFGIFCFNACGSIGTETGNPEVPPAASPVETSSSDTSTYSDEAGGFELSYSSGWTFEQWETTGADAAMGDGTQSDETEASAAYSTVTSYVEFSDGMAPEESKVEIYTIALASEPLSLANYLSTYYPAHTFEAYSNNSLSGYIYDDPAPGANGGDIKEIYFLKGTTLLYIVTELFEGSGSTEAAIILQTIGFAK